MNAHHSSYTRWTWIVALILGLCLLLLLLTGHGPTGTCCTNSSGNISSNADTASSAIITPISDSFSFKVTASEFTNEGDGSTVPWFNKAGQLKMLLADGDDWSINGDEKTITLIGTVSSESIKQQKTQEALDFFGPEVTINNEMVVTTSDPAMTTATPEVAKLYFALGNDTLPIDSAATLDPIIAGLKANGDAKAVISGFHDPSGSANTNKTLAKARAQGVHDALIAAGIDPIRIEMRKPQQTTGTGDPAEARRVEVSLE
jgi:outer membrane protein OmpA-like peptidoglycan-associated protein